MPGEEGEEVVRSGEGGSSSSSRPGRGDDQFRAPSSPAPGALLPPRSSLPRHAGSHRVPLVCALAALPTIRQNYAEEQSAGGVPDTVLQNHVPRTFLPTQKDQHPSRAGPGPTGRKKNSKGEVPQLGVRSKPPSERYLGSINPRWLPRIRKVGLDNAMAVSRDVLLKSRSTSPPRVRGMSGYGEMRREVALVRNGSVSGTATTSGWRHVERMEDHGYAVTE